MRKDVSAAVAVFEDQPVGVQAARDRAKAAAVIHVVAMATGTTPQEILRPTRARPEAIRARWMSVYLLHIGFSIPLARVAAAFGRDRTSVSYAVHQIENLREDVGFDIAMSGLESCVAAMPAEIAPAVFSGARA